MNDIVGLSGRWVVSGPGTAKPVPYESEKPGKIAEKPGDRRIKEVIDLFVGPAACLTAGAFSGLSSEFRKIRNEFSPSYTCEKRNRS